MVLKPKNNMYVITTLHDFQYRKNRMQNDTIKKSISIEEYIMNPLVNVSCSDKNSFTLFVSKKV